jgi:hypothetical protein
MDALAKAEALTAYKNELLDDVAACLLEPDEIPALMLEKGVELGIDMGKAQRIKQPPRINMGVSGKGRPDMKLWMGGWTVDNAQGVRCRGVLMR